MKLLFCFSEGKCYFEISWRAKYFHVICLPVRIGVVAVVHSGTAGGALVFLLRCRSVALLPENK